MSPSAGLWQRLITASVMRWLNTSIVPLPGAIVSFAPAMAATCPPHAPAADTIWPAITRYSVPLRTSTTRAASSRSPERSNPTTRWYGRAALPRAAASATLPSISDHGSTAASGTAKARRIRGLRVGFLRRTSATSTSAQSTSLAAHRAGNSST